MKNDYTYEAYQQNGKTKARKGAHTHTHTHRYSLADLSLSQSHSHSRALQPRTTLVAEEGGGVNKRAGEKEFTHFQSNIHEWSGNAIHKSE